MDVNKVILIGRLGKDPEAKVVGGKNLTTFSLATSYGTGDSQRTQWHQINVWEKLSEIAQKILHKGDQVYIEGRIDYTTSGEGDGKRYYTQIVATNLISLTSKRENGTMSNPTTSNTQVAEDDIPF